MHTSLKFNRFQRLNIRLHIVFLVAYGSYFITSANYIRTVVRAESCVIQYALLSAYQVKPSSICMNQQNLMPHLNLLYDDTTFVYLVCNCTRFSCSFTQIRNLLKLLCEFFFNNSFFSIFRFI